VTTRLIGYALRFVLILPAIILHEVSHGYAASLLGDPTAKSRGRLSLNPIVHIDPFGTLLLPALLIISGSPVVFGYAKPVPINPMYFKDRQAGMLITGAAGPLANLGLATVAGLAVRSMPTPEGAALFSYGDLYSILLTFSFFNLMLMFFNLIPIPPLDGSRVVQWFLHGQALRTYESLERYGFMILFGVMFLAPGLFDGYLRLTVFPLLRLITGLS
jgi:Zn-dependent protease